MFIFFFFFFSSRRRHTRFDCDWSSYVCSSDLVLAEPGLFRASTLFDVRFRRSPGERGAIPHRFPILFLTGTAEAPGRLLLLEGDAVEPGEEALAQVALDEPVVAAPGDRFILRTPSPAATAGGGVVLGIAARRRHRKRATSLDPMREAESALGDARASARAALRAAGPAGATDATLAPAIQRRPAEARAVLADLAAAGEAVPLPGGLHLAAAAWDEVRTAVLRALEEFHGRNRLREAARPAELRAALRAPEAVVDAAARALADEGRAEMLPGGRVRLKGRGAAPTEAEAGQLARLAAALREAKFATPREDELPSLLGVPAAVAESLLGLLVERGEALRLKDGVVLHAAVAEEGRNAVTERIRTAGGIQPAELKELLGATRKYSIPFLEHLDSTGVTLRVGDKRVLREKKS